MTDSLEFLNAFLKPSVSVKLNEDDATRLETFKIRVSALIEADLIVTENQSVAVRAIFNDLATLLISQESTSILATTQNPLLQQILADIKGIYTVESMHRTCRWGDAIADLAEVYDELSSMLNMHEPMSGNLSDLLDPTPLNLVALSDHMLSISQFDDAIKSEMKNKSNKVLRSYLNAVSTCTEIVVDKYVNQIDDETL